VLDTIAQTLAARTHFNTFGGNPVVCAQGRAVLKIIDRDKLQQNSLKIGNRILAGLRELQQKHNVIGDVRGKALESIVGSETAHNILSQDPPKPWKGDAIIEWIRFVCQKMYTTIWVIFAQSIGGSRSCNSIADYHITSCMRCQMKVSLFEM